MKSIVKAMEEAVPGCAFVFRLPRAAGNGIGRRRAGSGFPAVKVDFRFMVAEQENRTEDDQQRQEVREEAHEAEQQTVTEQASGQEAAAQTEEQHQDATPEELQQEGADAFASGDF